MSRRKTLLSAPTVYQSRLSKVEPVQIVALVDFTHLDGIKENWRRPVEKEKIDELLGYDDVNKSINQVWLCQHVTFYFALVCLVLMSHFAYGEFCKINLGFPKCAIFRLSLKIANFR